VHNLKTGIEENIGNVNGYAFNKAGNLLAFTIDAADQTGNGLVILNTANDNRLVLDSGTADYARLTWSEDGTAIAVLKGNTKKGYIQKENNLIAVTGIDKSEPKIISYNPAKDSYFPPNTVLSELASVDWSRDNTKLFFGIKEQEKEPEKPKEPAANVDVWHYKDERIQSVQEKQVTADRNFTYRAVLNITNLRFVCLTDDKMRSITPIYDSKIGIGRDGTKYITDLSWGVSQADYYTVNTLTGERKLFVSALGRSMGLSPDGKWYLYLKDKQLWIYNIETGSTIDMSKNAPVSFVNEDDDHPYEKPSYGVAGWTKDGTSVIVNHKFDLWSLPLNGGKAKNITTGIGEKEQIIFRYISLDSEERFIDTAKPLLLSAYGEWTKKSGFYSLQIGDEPKKIVFEDKNIGRPIKAKNADRILFTMQTFVDFPNYYVSDTRFTQPKMVTNANPQQTEYKWGSRILIDFKNSKGVRLQATLTLPADYITGTKYPMVVYFYEKVSSQHYQYSMPVYDDRPHMSTYSSNGYLVLMPDIVYTIGTPGSSALDCVTSAVKKVIELGYADPKRIGIQGHSWGGYETSFIATQTDLFACVVTGAPPTNLVSFYNELYNSTGTNQHGITETGQVRMGVNPWENLKLYESQSAVYNAEKITAPILILQGTADGAVDWHQGLELYNTGRRLGKKIIFLSYPGEDHHLTKKENQIDFQIRMKQFFDHYLKGEPAADWIENGVPYIKK
jgi:dipeptidyl aminopeptidase/acylaminoacyl peptidase